MLARTELADTLHRLANYLECQLSGIVPELLAESRTEAVGDLSYKICNLVEALRTIRDGREGGES